MITWLALALLAASNPAQPFVERGAELGLDFVHFNGMTGELYFAENVGAGVGFFDYDGDGDLDAYLLQGAVLDPSGSLDSALFPPPASMLPLTDRLYRNDLVADSSDADSNDLAVPRFVDVTARAGLQATGYGMGLAVADVDADGWLDVYVANLGPNQLLRNRGDGTFEDITARAGSGVGDSGFSVAATFLDAEGDGDRDLYVVNYVAFSAARNKVCSAAASYPDYCGPLSFSPLPDRLLRNGGDGRFEDISARSGLDRLPGTGLSAVAGDFTGDGRDDIFVANDQMANFLLVGQGEGRFLEEGLLAGVGLNERGQAEGSMGIALGDVNGDGKEEIFITHMEEETSSLYWNDGDGLFHDATLASGLGPMSFPYTGFGTDFLDYDLDGTLDLFVANGSVRVQEAQLRAGEPLPLRQRNQLYRGLMGGKGRFEDVTERAGPAFELEEVSRGAAVGDVDADGDPDVLVGNNAGPARLLINQTRPEASWLGVRVLDTRGIDAAGARVRIRQAEGQPQWRRVRFDGSYASVRDPGLLFGLGRGGEARDITVHWPGGRQRRIRGLPAGVYVVIPEVPASGEAIP